MTKCFICGEELLQANPVDDADAPCRVCGASVPIPGLFCLCSGDCGLYIKPDSSTATCPKCGAVHNLPEVLTIGGIK